MPNFIPFDRSDNHRVRFDGASVTIQRRGDITMNREAYQLLDEPQVVELSFAEEERLIGIRSLLPDDQYAIPVRNHNHTHTIAARVFAQVHGIDTSVARRYSCEMQEGRLVIDLKASSTEVTGPRTKRVQAKEQRA